MVALLLASGVAGAAPPAPQMSGNVRVLVRTISDTTALKASIESLGGTKDMWGASVDSLRLVDEARARGVDITRDQYPYTASQTGITALVPQWARGVTRD